MRFEETGLKDAYLIYLDKHVDSRGFFARTFCIEELKNNGINFSIEQCNISFNLKKGTLRGLHYQIENYAEAKIVTCTKGAMYDVILDLRSESPTFLEWKGFYLDATNEKYLYIPQGFAHGFQTLEDNTEIYYQMSASYNPDYARGIRWNDKQFDITWPDRQPVISDRDAAFPDFKK